MKLTGQALKALNSPFLIYESGPLETVVLKACDIESPIDSSLVFVSTPEHLVQLQNLSSLIVVAHQKLALPKDFQGFCIFRTPSIPASMATSLSFLESKKNRFYAGIHPTALISPSAKIDSTASIGAFAVIGDNVQIGKGTTIGSHCVLESNCQIGDYTLLHSQVFIGDSCKIGNYCELHPHTTIGSDGFGYVQDPATKVRHKIPQVGIVVIEDYVEVGANCAIDRATLGETKIGQGTKLDNLVHIGHNNKVGKHNAITAGFGMAGSSEIGDNCIFAGHVAVTDHIKICNDVIVGGKSGVTSDIKTPGAYVGYPVQPMQLGMKIMTSLSALPEIRKQMKLIMRHLNLKSDE